MKPLTVAGAALLAIGAAHALACSAPAGALSPSVLGTTLQTSGRIACYGSAGNWENQEILQAANALVDYKKGPADPVDPTSTIGSYTIADDGTGSGIITYTYAGSPSSSFAYYLVNVSGGAGNAGTYRFYQGADGSGVACTGPITIVVENTAGGCA
jgi:hypothetical protein